MTSIRKRLFLILMATTSAVWLSAVLWIQYSTRTEVNLVLDRRLQESAQMVASLIARSGGIVTADAAGILGTEGTTPALPYGGPHDFARQLVCQVWGFDGQLKSGSDGAPSNRLAEDVSGFTEREVEGTVWRVFTHVDADLGIRVMVGDAISVRDRLVSGVVFGLLAPAALILPLLAALIWAAVRGGLTPLRALADRLSTRPADDFRPLDDNRIVQELLPMVAALNGLFRRVETSIERERSFTTFAAHELKTPLAGLKTQAQVATMAPDEATRHRALAQIAVAVDRADRMVRQLLDMTAAENAVDTTGAIKLDGARILSEVAEGLTTLATARDVRLDLQASPGQWQTAQTFLLAPALRNLLENAILASPAGATVEAALLRDGDWVQFRVLDRGRGIADADRPHVTERFYRGANSPSGGGSGLGLAIVTALVARMGGELILSPRPGGGEVAELLLPAT